jgi:hypothetical protein
MHSLETAVSAQPFLERLRLFQRQHAGQIDEPKAALKLQFIEGHNL